MISNLLSMTLAQKCLNKRSHVQPDKHGGISLCTYFADVSTDLFKNKTFVAKILSNFCSKVLVGNELKPGLV